MVFAVIECVGRMGGIEIDVVPISWVEGTRVKWPKNKQNVAKQIRNQFLLDTNFEWYDCKVLKTNIGMFVGRGVARIFAVICAYLHV